MLDVRGLQKIYESKDRRVEALRDLTFSVEPGEFVCLVGPSGCGKTTLLKCLAGLLDPTAGTVSVEGKPVVGPPPGMAVVFQEYSRSLFAWMTVAQNIELPLRHKGVPRRQRATLVTDALKAVGLEDTPSAYPWQLSGGMQQRVAIARAVAYEPHVMLMDEPFAAVDAQTRADLEDLIRSIWERTGVTTLFVTHDIDEAVYLGQRVIVLSSSPTVVQDDLRIDLPRRRDQLETRALPQFTELRTHVYAEIRAAQRRAGPSADPSDTPSANPSANPSATPTVTG
jgi:NitT/TauT family transport system ATP-binding protein